MVTNEYLETSLSNLDLGKVDFVDLVKLQGQISYYTNLTADLTYLERFKAIVGDDVFECCVSYNFNRYQRLKRFRKYVSWCLSTNGYCLFVTLTFDDKMLSNSFAYRNKQVRSFLKSCSPYYLANIDFGSKNEREHYHALLYFPYEKEYQSFLSRCEKHNKSYSCNEWRSFNSFEVCGSSADDVRRLSKYINKLSNHAFKDSTNTCKYRVIYSDGITILNKLKSAFSKKAVLDNSIYSKKAVYDVVLSFKRNTNRIRDLDAQSEKEKEIARLLYKYQWKPYGDTFKPCNSDNEFIDSNGTLTSLDDLPF